MTKTVARAPETTAENLWRFYLTHEAGPVPCETLERFYALLTSPGTEAVELVSLDTSRGKATVNVYGPICDDANEYESAGPKHKKVRLKASYRLTKEELHDRLIGLTQEEKRVLVDIVRKKSGTDVTVFCRAFNVKAK